MKFVEFKKVYKYAIDNKIEMSQDEVEECVDALEGIAIERDRRVATIKQCAWFLRYHCVMFNGQWDMEELLNFREWYKKVDLLDIEPTNNTNNKEVEEWRMFSDEDIEDLYKIINRTIIRDDEVELVNKIKKMLK